MNWKNFSIAFGAVVGLAAISVGCGSKPSKPSEESLIQEIRDKADDYWGEYDAIKNYESYYPDGKYYEFIDSVKEKRLRNSILEYFEEKDSTQRVYFPKNDYQIYLREHSDSPNAHLLFEKFDSVWNVAIDTYLSQATKADPNAKAAIVGVMEYMRDNHLRTIFMIIDTKGACDTIKEADKQEILDAYHTPYKYLSVPSNSQFKKTENDIWYLFQNLRAEAFNDLLPKDFIEIKNRDKYTGIDSISPLINFEGEVKIKKSKAYGRELPELWFLSDKEGSPYTASGNCVLGLEIDGTFTISCPAGEPTYESHFIVGPNEETIDTYSIDGVDKSYNSMFTSCLTSARDKINKAVLGS